MHSCRRLIVAVGILAAAPGPAGAELPPGLEPWRQATIVEIVDGDTVVLDDGQELRLVGIQAPKLPLGRSDFEAWPMADEARRTLAELALGRQVILASAGTRGDRHGRILAHAQRDDGLWLQGAMLVRGLARVYTFPDNPGAAAEMLALETLARDARVGIWAHPYYAVLDPAGTPSHIDRFVVVEATVAATDQVRGRIYLNFGPDWREDFTVSIAPEDTHRFEAAGMDPLLWAGRQIRVRGWLYLRNGPMIDLTHPEQIEVLE